MACLGPVQGTAEWDSPPVADEGTPSIVVPCGRRSEVASRSGEGGIACPSPRAAGLDRPLRLCCFTLVAVSASWSPVFARGPAGCFGAVHSCGERCVNRRGRVASFSAMPGLHWFSAMVVFRASLVGVVFHSPYWCVSLPLWRLPPFLWLCGLAQSL